MGNAAEKMWVNFIDRLQAMRPPVSKKDQDHPIVNFLGGIKGYKKVFIEANQDPEPTDVDHNNLLKCAAAYVDAHRIMSDAMQDGINVQGAASWLHGATENLRHQFDK